MGLIWQTRSSDLLKSEILACKHAGKIHIKRSPGCKGVAYLSNWHCLAPTAVYVVSLGFFVRAHVLV